MPLYQSLFERLSSQHQSLGIIISKAGEGRLDFRYGPDKWSVRDIIAHLYCYQENFLERLKTILREDSPELPQYKHEDDALFEKRRHLSIAELLSKLTVKRREIFEYITALSEEDLLRRGIHPRYGKLSVVEWTEFFLLHEAHHLLAIFRMVHDTATRL